MKEIIPRTLDHYFTFFNEKEQIETELGKTISSKAFLKEHTEMLKILWKKFLNLWWNPTVINNRNRFGLGDLEQDL